MYIYKYIFNIYFLIINLFLYFHFGINLLYCMKCIILNVYFYLFFIYLSIDLVIYNIIVWNLFYCGFITHTHTHTHTHIYIYIYIYKII